MHKIWNKFLPTLSQTPKYLKIPLYKPILRFVDFPCMSFQKKTRASYVSQFNFVGRFLDEKFVFFYVCQKHQFFKQFWELHFFMQGDMLLDFKPWHPNKDKCLKKIMKISSDSHISRGGLLGPPMPKRWSDSPCLKGLRCYHILKWKQ